MDLMEKTQLITQETKLVKENTIRMFKILKARKEVQEKYNS